MKNTPDCRVLVLWSCNERHSLLIVFSSPWLVFCSIKCQNRVKNVNQCFVLTPQIFSFLSHRTLNQLTSEDLDPINECVGVTHLCVCGCVPQRPVRCAAWWASEMLSTVKPNDSAASPALEVTPPTPRRPASSPDCRYQTHWLSTCRSPEGQKTFLIGRHWLKTGSVSSSSSSSSSPSFGNNYYRNLFAATAILHSQKQSFYLCEMIQTQQR